MKKMLTLMLSLLLMLGALAPAAMAQSVSLPPFEYFGEDIILGQADAANNMYVYECADMDVLLDAIVLYSNILGYYYDVTSFQIDDESSDMFSYFYFTEYTGDADLMPETMDACPAPCYVMIAVGATQESYLAIVMGVDGITFDDDLSRLDQPTYEPPIAGEDGLVIYAPEDYNDAIPGCDALSISDNHYGYRYVSGGAPSYGNGDQKTWDLFVDYINALANSGYYQIALHEKDDLEERYALIYTGPGTVKETFGTKVDETGYALMFDSLLGDVFFYASFDIMLSNIEEVMASKGYDINGGGSNDNGGSSTPERPCPKCSGYKTIKCTSCWGSGQVDTVTLSSGKKSCPKCNGRGTVTCDSCNGSGKM